MAGPCNAALRMSLLSDEPTPAMDRSDAATAAGRADAVTPAGGRPATVHLFLWGLDRAPAEVAALRSLLDAAELARAARFVRPQDAARFVVARAGLREVLAGHAGCRPHDLRLVTGPHGKPRLDGTGMAGPLHFNLSHSHGLAALAVTGDGPVGVDIEAMRPVEAALADLVFAADERQALASLPEGERLCGFYNGWTRKEAILKADGRGLSLPLDRFGVSLAPAAAPRLLWARDARLAGTPWSLVAFEPAPGFVGAVAVPAPACRLVVTRWAA